MAIGCLLWDFGDTLYDELSLWRGSEEWMAVYASFGDPEGIGAAWSLGEVTDEEVFARISQQFGLTLDAVRAHLARVDLFQPFPFTIEFFRSAQMPQAIVTANPASFRRLARDLDLDTHVETIVISGEEGSVDKAVLSALAIERMAGAYAPSEALLIDNKRPNVDDWRAQGGAGYHYIDDATFRADVAGGIDGLAQLTSA